MCASLWRGYWQANHTASSSVCVCVNVHMYTHNLNTLKLLMRLHLLSLTYTTHRRTNTQAQRSLYSLSQRPLLPAGKVLMGQKRGRETHRGEDWENWNLKQTWSDTNSSVVTLCFHWHDQCYGRKQLFVTYTTVANWAQSDLRFNQGFGIEIVLRCMMADHIQPISPNSLWFLPQILKNPGTYH